MSEWQMKSAVPQQPEQKIETRGAARRLVGVATLTAAMTVLVAVAVYAQDKYSLISPGGIAFSDFRGYGDWPSVSSARQDDIIKVIVANPKMIAAYKAGIPASGQPFPEG